jgi:hypothetical protein
MAQFLAPRPSWWSVRREGGRTEGASFLLLAALAGIAGEEGAKGEGFTVEDGGSGARARARGALRDGIPRAGIRCTGEAPRGVGLGTVPGRKVYKLAPVLRKWMVFQPSYRHRPQIRLRPFVLSNTCGSSHRRGGESRSSGFSSHRHEVCVPPPPPRRCLPCSLRSRSFRDLGSAPRWGSRGAARGLTCPPSFVTWDDETRRPEGLSFKGLRSRGECRLKGTLAGPVASRVRTAASE